jgi:hypothetical protein
MAVASSPPPTRKSFPEGKTWTDRISRSGYFFGAVLLHLIVFLMVATWVVFPAFKPPAEDFTKTYLPAGAPPPPPPTPPAMQVPTTTIAAPSTTIISPAAAPTFNVPLPDLTPAATPSEMTQKAPDKVVAKANTIAPERLAKIMETEQKWGRNKQNILNSGGDPKNVVARFPVYLASYANGDWGYGQNIQGGKIIAGSLCNMVTKINEWSKGNITGEVVPAPLSIGGPELLDKKPPFIYFTGHKDFTLTEQEIQNLRDYLQVGGAIWGDNALPGRGSRFDVAFRREMKRVVPDIDKNFEPVPMTSEVFTKSWFPLAKVAEGMNYYAESFEHLDIDGKLAIFYTPNDYNDMLAMRILPGDTQYKRGVPRKITGPLDYLTTPEVLIRNENIFFRNFDLPSCLDCDKVGMNIVSYMLVRFDKELLLTP